MDQSSALKFIDRIAAVAPTSQVMVFNQSSGQVYAHNMGAMRQSKALIMFILSEFQAEMGRALMSPQADWLCIHGATGGAFFCRVSGEDVISAITHDPRALEPMAALMRGWAESVRTSGV